MNKIKRIVIVVFMCSICCLLKACNETNDDEKLIVDVSDDNATDEKYVETQAMLCVYIVGEVVNPGVYELCDGARIHDVTDMAGGFTDMAAQDYINLADRITDGEKIVVYSVEEVQNAETELEEKSLLVNINTADEDMLMTLPGIGESRAGDIIKYREENGRFENIEDIMNVSGIKESAFSKIENLITVN